MLTKFRPIALSPVFGRSSFSRDFDTFFDSIFDYWGNEINCTSRFNIDMQDVGDAIVLSADLPGISKEEIDITVDRGMLSISGERKTNREKKDGDCLISERSFGKFFRNVQLPEGIDESSINAKLEEGVLTVTLQKKEDIRSRKIPIK